MRIVNIQERWWSMETLKPYFQKLTGIDNVENSYLPSEWLSEWENLTKPVIQKQSTA